MIHRAFIPLAVAAVALVAAPAPPASQSHADGRCTFDHDPFSATSETGPAAEPPQVPWNGLPIAWIDPPPPTPVLAARADAGAHALHALAVVVLDEQHPANDCTVNARIRDTVTALPGGGHAAGEIVRLVLTPGFHGAFSQGPRGKPDASLTTADAFASLSLVPEPPDSCVGGEDGDCFTDPAASFSAEVHRRADANRGSAADPDGSFDIESRWSWQLSSNSAPDDGDGGESSARICPAWPDCNVSVNVPEYASLKPFEVSTASRSIAFEARIGQPLALDARLNLLVQAYSGPGSSGADLLRTLQFGLAPAPGYEGVGLAYESAGGDTRSPVLALPPGVRVNATSREGAVVTYAATATDDTDPSPQVQCEPASGSTFPIGRTTVACTATDDAGNRASGSFTVTVAGAVEQLRALTEEVLASTRLPSAAKAQLLSRLQALLAGLEEERPLARRAACVLLEGFEAALRQLSGPALAPAQASAWSADARRIRAVLGC